MDAHFPHTDCFRQARAKSEGPLAAPITNGNGEVSQESSRKNSREKKKSVYNMFLPSNNEEPVMVLKKHSKDMSRKSSFDSGVGLEGDEDKKKKKAVMATSDKHEQAKIIAELCARLAYIDEKMKGLEEESERIQQVQRTSNDFQIQVMKQSDAPDLEKGVTKVLDMVQFDRKQELARLIKKAEDFKRRGQRGVKLDGDDDELRDMQIAAGDLEKKIMRGYDEMTRLQVKTENVVVRQKEQAKITEGKRAKIAMSNGTMRILMSDAKQIDSILSEVRDFQNTEQKEGEKSVQEFFTLMGEEAMDQVKEDIERIEEYKAESERLKEEVWEDRLESNRIQTAVVDQDPEVNVEEAAGSLRTKIQERKMKTREIKQEYESFLRDQKRRYDVLLKTKREEAEKLRLKKVKEEEDRKKKEEEEKEKLRLLKIEQEKERKRKEEEARLAAIAAAEQKKKADEAKAEMVKLAIVKGEINKILEKEHKNMMLMKKEAERVELKQREVEMILEKRHEVTTEPGKLKNADFLDSMHTEFTNFSEEMQTQEDKIVIIGRLLMDSSQDVNELKEMAVELSKDMEQDWKKLESIGRDTDNRHTTQQKLLTSQLLEIKRREEEAREAARRAQEEMDAAGDEIEKMRLMALEQQRLLEEQERLRKLREEEEAARMLEEERKKRMMDEEERAKRLAEEEEERLRRLAEEEEARRMREQLGDLNDSMRMAENELAEVKEEWKNFDWDDQPWDGEYAGEMLGCAANPAFLYGIRDPKKIMEILARAARMKELRSKLKADAEKMKYICSAIEKMIELAKEAEEKRWARQNTEWVKDAPVYNPAENISSTHNVSFGAASTMTVEENLRLIAERKASRQNMAPETMKELAKHSGYDMDELEGGYGGWSRRRLANTETKKPSNSKYDSSSSSRSKRDRFL